MITKALLSKIANHEISLLLTERFLKKYRHIEDEFVLKTLRDEMSKRGCFYTPSDDFILKVFGKDTYELLSELFIGVHSVMLGCMAIPMFTVDDTYLGMISSKPLREQKYKYPESFRIKKSRAFLMSKDSFKKALSQDYIFVVEGVFDEIFLASFGYPVCGLNGIEVEKNLSKILNLIGTVIVISDNDTSGSKMFLNISESLRTKVVSLKITTKDIADFLTVKENVDRFSRVIKEHERGSFPLKLINVL